MKSFFPNLRRGRRAGFAVVYFLVAFSAICGLVSLAVDFGRVQLDRAELQLAADAAARYGAAGLPGGAAVASANATSAAAANSIEGVPVKLQSSDIQVGVWNSATSVFTPTSVSPNAVRVTAQLSAARGTSVPLMFAGILGFAKFDLKATATALFVPQTTTSTTITGLADPWLAGMPNGTTANFYSQFGDKAPYNAPVQSTVANMTAGQALEFNFSGNVTTGGQASKSGYGPDGNVNDTFLNIWALENGNSEHGIGNVTAPLGSIIGVFLNDNEPDTTAAPAALDFSTDASRNFSTLSPQLKQPFFIGDGLMDDEATQQRFIVPAGATRLYLGVMDFQQWSDNGGSMLTLTTVASQVILVN
jgi:Flp pilus assembly protein TadG